MYRINLHPEFASRKAASRRRALLTGLAAVLLGTEALLVGGVVLSARLLEERVEATRVAAAPLEARFQAANQLPAEDLALARAILGIRTGRIDWSPKLAAVGERIGPNLTLVELKGRNSGARADAELQMSGRFRSGASDLEGANRFVADLRGDDRFALAFPDCALENIGGQRTGFTVICRPEGEKQ
jgi:hypothetical protein